MNTPHEHLCPACSKSYFCLIAACAGALLLPGNSIAERCPECRAAAVEAVEADECPYCDEGPAAVIRAHWLDELDVIVYDLPNVPMLEFEQLFTAVCAEATRRGGALLRPVSGRELT
jgi:endogenous inhibitor of DNA gyrase (YacG/DUF329 family)